MPSKLCFQTDMSVYKNSATFNKDAFTFDNVLNMKTQIISDKSKYILEEEIECLQKFYKSQLPHVKLWIYDLDKKYMKTKNIICIILFINDVYGLHYICNDLTLVDTKYNILYMILNNPENNKNNKYVFQINTFNSDGYTETSTFENILCC